MHNTPDNTGKLSPGSSPVGNPSSEKRDGFQAETVSVPEALEIDEDRGQESDTDLEKGGVAAPCDSDQPTSQTSITAQDWNGPDDPENPHNVRSIIRQTWI